MKRLTWPVLGLALALAGSCGDDDDTTPDADAGDTGGDDGGGSGVLYETCPSTCAVPPTCRAGQLQTCCVCVDPPIAQAGRTACGIMSEYCDEAPVDPLNTACLQPSGFPDPPPTDPPTVNVRGVVDVYGNGNTVAGGDITVEFYRMAEDGSLGALLDTSVATLAACEDSLLPTPFETGLEATCCPGPCQELMPDTDDCTPTSGDCRALWYYEVTEIPTSTPLILHTSGNAAYWKDLYYSNVFYFPEDETPGGYVFYRAKTLSVDDWRAIPATAGDFDGIAAGQGAIAGEIHDCDNVKVYNATVGVNPTANTFAYFNGVEEKPYPDTLRTSTNSDSLYAALELAPGLARVSAVALIGDDYVNLGWWDAYVFPDALTVVTIRGTRPTQVPTP